MMQEEAPQFSAIEYMDELGFGYKQMKFSDEISDVNVVERVREIVYTVDNTITVDETYTLRRKRV